MKLLALESSTTRCSVALLIDGALSFREAEADARNSEVLLPMVRRLLSDAGVGVTGLDGIAFGAGPGAFTGLRVACGAAQGLAFGADLPLVAVGTLEILAEGLHAHRPPVRASAIEAGTGVSGADAGRQSQLAMPGRARRVLVGMDARMGECYWGEAQHVDADWILLAGPLLCRPDQVPIPEGLDWEGVGDAFALFGAQLEARLGVRYPQEPWGTAQPEAAALVRLATVRFARGQTMAPEHAQPVYVRYKVALTRQERGVGP